MKMPSAQPPMPVDPYYEDAVPMQREQQDAELTRWQLESDEQIEMFKHSLKGEVWSNKEKCWIVNTEARLMNDQAVEVLASELRDRVNKLSTLSNLNEEQIYNIIQRFEINIARLLVINYEAWEIRSPAYLYSIRDRTLEFLFIGLQRCKDKTFLGFLERAKQYVEQRRVISDEKRGGKFSPMR